MGNDSKEQRYTLTGTDLQSALNALNRLQVQGVKNCQYIAYIASVLQSGQLVGDKETEEGGAE